MARKPKPPKADQGDKPEPAATAGQDVEASRKGTFHSHADDGTALYLQDEKGEQHVELGEEVTVTVNGNETTLDDLKRGDKVQCDGDLCHTVSASR